MLRSRTVRASELRKLRLGADLTQRQLANRLDLTIRAISRYETGARKIPKVVAIAARCVVLHNR
jgi:transcriptional regulator with XRE-family HTH domain